MYYLSTGTRATWSATTTDGVEVGPAPSNLTEMSSVANVSLNTSRDESEVGARGSAYKQYAAGRIDVSVEFDIPDITSDASFLAVQKAYLTAATIAIAVLDGSSATVGVMGLWADFEVVKFERAEQLDEGVRYSVTLRPAYAAVPPEWVKVAAS
jgi:hypothetical protein